MDELDKLPPISQTGANTFGCLINGKAYTPSGRDGNKPNFSLIIESGFQNGTFLMKVYRLEGARYEALSFASNDIKNTGIYTIAPTASLYVDYNNDFTNCNFLFSSLAYSKGFLKLTKYDLTNGIFSGEFECKLYSPTSCDTLNITNGRFDKKL